MILMMKYFGALCLSFICCMSNAQETLLQPVETGLGLFSDITISKVRLLSETEESMNLEVTYEIEDDKTYAIAAQILSPRRVLLKEVVGSREKLSRKSGSVDLNFNLKPNLNKSKYTKPYLEAGFVKIILSETNDDEDSWSDILDVLGDDNPLSDALGESFLFKHEKQWRIGGGKGMIIQVPITPLGNASSIKQ